MKLATKTLIAALLLVLGMNQAQARTRATHQASQMNLLVPPPPPVEVTGTIVCEHPGHVCLVTAAGVTFECRNGQGLMNAGHIHVGDVVTARMVGNGHTSGVVIVLN